MHWARITRHSLRSWSSPPSCASSKGNSKGKKYPKRKLEEKAEVMGTPLHNNLVTGEHLPTKWKATSQFPLCSMITIQALLCPLIYNLRLFLSSYSRPAFLSGPSSAFASPSGKRIKIMKKTMVWVPSGEYWIQVLPNTNQECQPLCLSGKQKGHTLMMAATVLCADFWDMCRGKTRL